MKAKARVICEYEAERTARAIASALGPDNLEAPRGMQVVTKTKGKRVVTRVEMEGKVETLLRTLDDLLACTSTAEDSVPS